MCPETEVMYSTTYDVTVAPDAPAVDVACGFVVVVVVPVVVEVLVVIGMVAVGVIFVVLEPCRVVIPPW